MKSKIQKIATMLILTLPFIVIGQSSQKAKIKTYTVPVAPHATYLPFSSRDVEHIYNERGEITSTYRPSASPSFFSFSQAHRENKPIKAGNILYLKGMGYYNYHRQTSGSDFTDDLLIGVFVDSRGSKLFPGNKSDYDEPKTIPSLREPSLQTNIPQDFWIPTNSEECVRVEVPTNANRILFSVFDSHFSDNEDKDNDFQSKVIQIIKQPDAGVWYSNPVQVVFDPQLNPEDDYSWPYDLVENKPFIVQAGFQKLLSNSVDTQERNKFENTVFNPVLRVRKKGQSKVLETINQCSNKFGRGSESDTNTISNCSFRGSDFILWDQPEQDGHITRYGSFNQVFLLAGGLKAGDYDLEVDLYPNSNLPCDDIETTSKFGIKIHKTHSPRIGLARANCDNISINCTVKTKDFNKFLNQSTNSEIQIFNKLFPVEEKTSKFFPATYNTVLGIDQLVASIKTVFTSNPRQDTEEEQKIQSKILLALQTSKLATHKVLFRYNYLVGIGTSVFFTRALVGTDDAGIAYPDFVPPFNRVAFVNSDHINTGTLLHELAHLLGQKKEFYRQYETVIMNGQRSRVPLPDSKQSQCTGHNLKIKSENGNFSRTSMACYKFNTTDKNKEGRYEYYDFHNRQFIKKRYSIMADSNNLNEQTIDRDTFIKAFNHLKSKPKDPALTLVSGIYANGRLFDAKVSNHGAGILHPLSTEGDLHIMLKNSSNEMLVETKLSSSFEIETLSSTGGGERITSNIVPIVVAFPYQATATKAVMMKKNEDGTETMVFSKTLPVDSNSKHLFSSHQAYSTVNNFPSLKKNNTVELLKKGGRKATSSAWTKFMYSPGFELIFEYNACSNQNRAGDGIALLLAKESVDYTANSLLKSNQGVNFNRKGLSLHLDMSGNIYLKNGSGQSLATAVQTVNTGCNRWKRLKLKIERNGKLTLLEGENSLLSHNLTTTQIEEIADHLIAFNAYSQRQGQYKIRKVSINALPVETTEEEDTNEEETDEENNE